MVYAELFGWWIASIAFNILFVIGAAIYLHRRRKIREKGVFTGMGKLVLVLKQFVFVWVLLALLIFYVYSVGVGSYFLFAAGNVVVEVLLFAYVLKAGKSSVAGNAIEEARFKQQPT
jgi:Ca2+/Na+ antiporter